jgi:hypothetical protein
LRFPTLARSRISWVKAAPVSRRRSQKPWLSSAALKRAVDIKAKTAQSEINASARRCLRMITPTPPKPKPKAAINR